MLSNAQCEEQVGCPLCLKPIVKSRLEQHIENKHTPFGQERQKQNGQRRHQRIKRIPVGKLRFTW
jgi:hypothetical protein